MEDEKHGGSAFSLTAQLFGAIESTPSSKAYFASLFPPPKVSGESSSCLWKKQNQTWNNNFQGTLALSKEEGWKRNFQQSMEPCHLSSSLYYGGQEMYSQSSCTQNSGLQHAFKMEAEDDDQSGNQAPSTSPGNWWQGSLYY